MSRKTLIAVELDEFSANCVLERAASLVGERDECHIIHVVDPTSVAYAVDLSLTGIDQEFEESAIQRAEQRVTELLAKHEFRQPHIRVKIGKVAKVIHDLIDTEGFDRLIIGSHGWHGWQRLLGTHASAIMSRAAVDTWVLKLPARPEQDAKHS